MSAGRVTAVKEIRLGSELTAAVGVAATALQVAKPHEFDWEGGQLQIGDEVKPYTVDPADGTLELASGLALAYAAEEPVYLHPKSIERLAYLQATDEGEELVARVAHEFHPLLPEGIRTDEAAAEAVETEIRAGELIVTDVFAREPEMAGQFMNTAHDEEPVIALGLDPLLTTYAPVTPVMEVIAESDSLMKVQWGVTVVLYSSGFTINGSAFVSLFVAVGSGAAAAVGVEREVGLELKADPTGPNPSYTFTVAGETPIAMEAGEVYLVDVRAKKTMTNGNARVKGAKSGGLSRTIAGG